MDTRDKPDFIIPSVLAQSARLRAELHRAADFHVAQNATSAGCLVSTGGGAGTRKTSGFGSARRFPIPLRVTPAVQREAASSDENGTRGSQHHAWRESGIRGRE
jgi:hypothetical protein